MNCSDIEERCIILERERKRAAAEHGRENLRLIEAATPQAEISFLCGEIRRLVASEGIRYREIAVITGDLETYSREILRQFEKNQIPCFIDYKKNILSNPMVELSGRRWRCCNRAFPMNRCFDS